MTHRIDSQLSLSEVSASEEDVAVMYDLLGKRHAHQNISHAELPSRDAHRTFVGNHPYRHWFLVLLEDAAIGTVYLTNDNVLGIFIEDDHLAYLGPVIRYVATRFDPLPPIPSQRNGAFTINLAPENARYASVVEAIGGVLIQQTYRLPGTTETT